ncbi:Peroxisome biosynthesis protein pex1 [Desmophyllum pertusum]|uniref:Peroxisome biosynthesis protein pex1 n=1 Tax=Desmophyllum pertusum TaxID=174260 RepID=A0A9X0D136_9CNID|nr:Peroxisome biosynthesis protein pex1 [Desmophyllum pertusum]
MARPLPGWSGEVIRSKKHDPLNGSSSVIQLGKKFADSLGLNDNQQVLVEPVISITSCNRISVDPVSANDWEILELHAGYIESAASQSINLEPNANCVRLDEFTEVVVSPKTRTFPQPKKDQQVSIPTGKEITTQDSSQAHGLDTEQEHAATSTASVSYFEDSDSQFVNCGNSFLYHGFRRQRLFCQKVALCQALLVIYTRYYILMVKKIL